MANPAAPAVEAHASSASPVHHLIAAWREGETPPAHLVFALRGLLYEACLLQIRLRSQVGRSYDPATDYRVQWASQLLQVAEGTRPAIDPNVEAVAAMLLDPPLPLSGKHRAAGEH